MNSTEDISGLSKENIDNWFSGKASVSILLTFLGLVIVFSIAENSSSGQTRYNTGFTDEGVIILEAPLTSEGFYKERETFQNGVITASVSVFDDTKIGRCGTPTSQIRTYTVKDGDTISEIADAFCVSEETIAWQNDIHRTSQIKEGRELVILPVSGVLHKIKEGETLHDISHKYDIAEEIIASFNDIRTDTTLSTNDFIVIPEGEREGFAIYRHAHGRGGTSFAWGVNGPNRDEFFINPIPGFTISQHLHGHNAVDVASPTGTPIRSAGSGTVIISKNSGWNGGYGKYIVIEHKKGLQTLYAHNSSNIVHVGDVVSRGDIIGYTGSTGYSLSSHGGDGSHLHFEVHGAQNILRDCRLGSICNI